VVLDDWPAENPVWANPEFEHRRYERLIKGRKFDTYKELYRRVDGGLRQSLICGSERGLGKSIFEYYFLGQESSMEKGLGSGNFGPESFGWKWTPTEPVDSVFVAPHAHCQGNGIFTLAFWRSVICKLLDAGLNVTVNTPERSGFGSHERLTYSFKHDDLPALFRQISNQRLVLCGNTGVGWIAGAHGVPLIGCEPKFFLFLEYRYRQAGVRSLVDVFTLPNSRNVASRVLRYLRPPPDSDLESAPRNDSQVTSTQRPLLSCAERADR